MINNFRVVMHLGVWRIGKPGPMNLVLSSLLTAFQLYKKKMKNRHGGQRINETIHRLNHLLTASII